MTIHTHKLSTFALYAAYADEFGMPVFGSTRDEALNNLQDEIAVRVGNPVGEAGLAREPLSQPNYDRTI
jgi:hypothetical protein